MENKTLSVSFKGENYLEKITKTQSDESLSGDFYNLHNKLTNNKLTNNKPTNESLTLDQKKKL
jgi:hypothetical protein